ncbi:UDP-N-acetylglucosamine transferase subunit ALG13 homolog isoform X2 [Protopterus annectens]|nr:UDP-N-acetylglucosamine transferase subunit ALG13 homolog isoform X2 [Protopterus annectens]
MSNHQLELAQQLHRNGHLFYCTCSTLREKLVTMDLTTLQPFPSGEPERFAVFMDKALGLQ